MTATAAIAELSVVALGAQIRATLSSVGAKGARYLAECCALLASRHRDCILLDRVALMPESMSALSQFLTGPGLGLGDAAVLQLADAVFLYCKDALLSRLADGWLATVVDVSEDAAVPTVLLPDSTPVRELRSSVADLVSALRPGPAVFEWQPRSDRCPAVALVGVLLGYPVVYHTRGPSNCLGGAHLLVFREECVVALERRRLVARQFSVPASLRNVPAVRELLESKQFIIDSRTEDKIVL